MLEDWHAERAASPQINHLVGSTASRRIPPPVDFTPNRLSEVPSGALGFPEGAGGCWALTQSKASSFGHRDLDLALGGVQATPDRSQLSVSVDRGRRRDQWVPGELTKTPGCGQGPRRPKAHANEGPLNCGVLERQALRLPSLMLRKPRQDDIEQGSPQVPAPPVRREHVDMQVTRARIHDGADEATLATGEEEKGIGVGRGV